jgi:hypothetical protein
MAKTKTNFDHTKAPFVYFGGKSQASSVVWAALGDPNHYVEPFCGSMAVLLKRPHECNRAYFSETVNDLDGLLINAWRSIQLAPEATANACSWPVSEIDIMARQLAIMNWKKDKNLEILSADPDWCDPKIAGYWLHGLNSWIGSGYCGGGCWSVKDNRIYKRDRKRDKTEEEGVGSKIPQLGSDNGRGTHAPQLRENGVGSQLLHLTGNGQGTNAPQLRENGVGSKLPPIGDNGRGTNHANLRELNIENEDLIPHDITMPKLLTWFKLLSARLRHVRICCGDWKRNVTKSAAQTLSCKTSDSVGIFLDPPYKMKDRCVIYTNDSSDIANQVLDWCAGPGTDSGWRIVLAGYSGQYDRLLELNWIEVPWFKRGFLSGGFKNIVGGEAAQKICNTERLFLSPSCIKPEVKSTPMQDMFGG